MRHEIIPSLSAGWIQSDGTWKGIHMLRVYISMVYSKLQQRFEAKINFRIYHLLEISVPILQERSIYIYLMFEFSSVYVEVAQEYKMKPS